MPKLNIYLCQVNNQFGDHVFLPYSVGIIQSYSMQFEIIKRNYQFKDPIYLRENIREIVRKLDKPIIFGLSCYIWNWEWSKELAKNIKFYYPDCLIIMGGPQIPKRSENFFFEHPYVDILVHNEGEISFYDICVEHLNDYPNYLHIPGLSVKIEENKCYSTPYRELSSDLSQFPSPYLSGVFDNIIMSPYKWSACHETHRGCPYGCSFCDWGSAVFTKVRQFETYRIEKELEWFGKQEIVTLYNCDPNYGLFNRDYNLTEKLVEVKQKYGYPRHYRPSFAKNSDDKIFSLAKLLNESGLQECVTLSMQSMNDDCLELVKRKNIKIEDLSRLLGFYRMAQIPTYTELVMGLPGESYESFKEGIHRLFATGQHDGIWVHLCEILPNSEIAEPLYMKQHGIMAKKIPIILAYATPNPDDIQEYFDIVIKTNTLSTKDWRMSYLFAWTVQCFHCLNLTQYLSVYFWVEYGISYADFYEGLLEFAMNNPLSIIGQEFQITANNLDDWLNGIKMDTVLPKYGNIIWYPEEASFLKIMDNLPGFYTEMNAICKNFLEKRGVSLLEDFLEDLIKYQKSILITPHSPKSFSVQLKYNLPNFFYDAFVGNRSKIDKSTTKVVFYKEQDYRNNLEKFALDVGRKSGKLHHNVKVVAC